MDDVTWRKATRSTGNGGVCVELARLGGDRRGVRDSKDPDQGHLTLSRAALRALLTEVKAGRHDL
jgi:hypothetical protein